MYRSSPLPRELLYCLLAACLAGLAACRGEEALPAASSTVEIPTQFVTETAPPATRTAIATAEPTAAATDTAPSAPTTEPTATSALPVATLAPGWTRLDPGGDTVCARGTPYAFWARPGRPDRLMIYFQGGGACWNAETCRPGSPFFTDSVAENNDPNHLAGVFDFDNAANPFRDWSVVFIAYCTGDVHWGSQTRAYPAAGGGEVTIEHKGFVNASAALNWTYRQFSNPEHVFVTGCSAGAVGSAAHAPYISEHYASATVSQLGDSLAFVFHRSVDLQTDYGAYDNFPAWIPELAGMEPGAFTMARYVSALAGTYPNQTFAQFNTRADSIQDLYYMAVGGPRGQFPADLAASLRAIHAAAPNFRSYTAGGSQHCITPYDRFYTLSVNEVPLRDWVARLALGEDVPTVTCPECEPVTP